MRQQGRLTEWNDDRGYGFITPLSGGPRLFAHVSSFPRDQRRPMETDLVTYTASQDDKGRPRAAGVLYLTPARAARSPRPMTTDSPGLVLSLIGSVIFLIVLLVLSAFGIVPLVLTLAYATLSVASFAAYGLDKSAAKKGAWRTEESALHLLALLGGWPGALVAQRVFRHKTRKQPFQTVFWVTVVVNCAALGWLVAVL